jgi:hypothetical protein
MRPPSIVTNGRARAERLRAVLLVLAVWAVGFGLAAVLVCPGERRPRFRPAAGAAPCILLTVDPQSAGPAGAERVDTCPGDCTPAGAYCVKIIPGKDRP